MAGDWLENLFQAKEHRLKEATEKRQQELLRAKKLVELSRPIWAEIKKSLVKRVNQFNERVPEADRIEIVEGTAEFALQLKHRPSVHSFVVSFTPSAGVIRYGLSSGRDDDQGWLSVKVDEDFKWSIEDQRSHKLIPIHDVDEVILGNYLTDLLSSP